MKVCYLIVGVLAFVYIRMPSGRKGLCLSRNLSTFWSEEEATVVQFQNQLLQYTLRSGNSIRIGEDRIEDLITTELDQIDRTILKSLYRKLGIIFEGIYYLIQLKTGIMTLQQPKLLYTRMR
jgi:hypothetical protein